MRVGTKSVLFGAHCFLLHPWFVAWGWWKLYGVPWDPRLWVAFIVHDLGYVGKPNMDGPEGETHVEFGARIMGLFGPQWADFSRYHSRFYAKKDGKPFSRLCVADKLAVALMPGWMYVPLTRLSGEINEYMQLSMKRANAGEGGYGWQKYAHMRLPISDQREWYAKVQQYLLAWVTEHRDGREDCWTPDMRDPRMDRERAA